MRLLILSMLLVPAFSRAEILSCASPDSLRKKVNDCAENAYYSDAARACVDKFEAIIGSAQLLLAQELEKLGAADKQSGSLQSAKASYEAAVKKLDALVKLGGVLKGQVAAYKKEVVLPEDFASVGEIGFDTKIFLDGNPCYRETQNLLASYEELMGLKAKELELTSKITSKMAERALKGELKLEAKAILPMLKVTGTGKGGPQPASKQPVRDSDISGTEKQKK